MKQLQFFGYGDDTFGGGSTNPADGEFYRDNFASTKPIVYRISAGKQSFYVVGQYGHGAGTWRIGVQMPDEGEFPSWRIWYEPQHEYSPSIVLEVPDDATVVDVTEAMEEK